LLVEVKDVFMSGNCGLLYKDCTALVGSHGAMHKVRGEAALNLHDEQGQTVFVQEPTATIVPGFINNYYHFVAEGTLTPPTVVNMWIV
jgi:hypothetical protein